MWVNFQRILTTNQPYNTKTKTNGLVKGKKQRFAAAVEKTAKLIQIK